ncbi:MAG TPA: 50S ribosomal protein L9 [Candidatus Paceibacterota bacterium]
MQVILLKDVGGVGQRGGVKEVADGYALNFLIPNGLAEQATKKKLDEHEVHQKEISQANVERDKHWKKVIENIAGKRITVSIRANNVGHLYTQLPVSVIAQAIRDEFGADIPEKAIKVTHPVKEVGEAIARVRLGEHETELTINVVAA